jgi:hypothetical protein
VPFGRASSGETLEKKAQLVDREYLLKPPRGYAQLPTDTLDEPVLLETSQGLAYRCPADLARLSKSSFAEDVSGRKLTRQYEQANLLIRLRIDRYRRPT